MKIIYFLSVVLFYSVNSFCQKTPRDKYAIPFKKVKDTTFAYVDNMGKIVNLPGMPFVRKSWPENGKWKEVLIDQSDFFVAGTGWYKDPELKVKDGVFEKFYAKGTIQISAKYINNQKDGLYQSFYENGKPMEIYTYLNDVPIDSAWEYYDDGSAKFRGFFDKSGTGLGTEFYKDGKEKLSGAIKAGKRNGTWVVKNEAGLKIMEANFLEDSLASTSCYGADGKTLLKGNCIFEQPAAFPGGESNWAKFLQKNLRYPNEAVKKGIQGIVRVQFVVDKDGSVKELNIVTSPDKSLSNEVLRLMKQSPDWLPAIQYNKPVIYRHIQAITFMME